MKLAWLSDLHFSAEGPVSGHDPQARLRAVIDYLNAHHRDAAYCVISGDLVNRGAEADYRALASLLDDLHIPCLPLPGNHDDRALLAGQLALPPDRMSGFVQYSVRTDDGLIVCLDTQKTGSDSGQFCRERQDWLSALLKRNAGLPAYIFAHHPPMPLGLPMQDQDRIENGDDLLALLARFPDVRYLFLGHVHRPVSGVIGTLPFTSMRSVLYQAPAPWPAWDWASFIPAREAPDIGIVTLQDGNVTIQHVQPCPVETGLP